MAKWLSIFSALSFLLCSSAIAEEGSFENDFEDGVAALRIGEFNNALQLLERAAAERDDPRVDYYLGYAHEKIGNCDRAKTFYTDAAVDPSATPALRKVARDALVEFEARCSIEDVVAPVETSRTVSVAWVTVGTIVTVLGVLTLVAVPVKNTIDREAGKEFEQWYDFQYGCDVDFGIVKNECDTAPLEADPTYAPYLDQVRIAKKSTKIVLITGVAVTVLGGVTLLGALFSGIDSGGNVSVGPGGVSDTGSF